MYYIYTGKVNFAPLRSQGRLERVQAITNYHLLNSNEPRLCSPKSMYRAADIVGRINMDLCILNKINGYLGRARKTEAPR